MIEVRCRCILRDAQGPFTLDVAFSVREGESVTLFGPSGSGKTTLLRAMAGLLRPDDGMIRVRDETWYSAAERIHVPPQRRCVGYVFQDPALFPHLSVKGNLRYALPRGADPSIIDHLMDLVDIRGLAEQRPSSLSGGQRQCVALARALVRRPPVLLLDEPLSALDAETRERLHSALLQLRKDQAVTTLLVSHDLREVFSLSDRVIVLERGAVRREGTPTELFAGARAGERLTIDGVVTAVRRDETRLLVTIAVEDGAPATPSGHGQR